ncbi:MAG: hypothetical protein Q8S20_12540 [Sulfuritalea sp.]|nr:hypothetical protein [Sulfuritalea sp.]
MDIQTFWIIALSIATPIAGVVGFAIQLRQVKTARLENEKLQLEIAALRERAVAAEQRIVKPTNEEVHQVNHGRPMFSRYSSLESRGSYADESSNALSSGGSKTPFKEKVFAIAALSAVALVAAYLVYDIYRLVIWVSSLF